MDSLGRRGGLALGLITGALGAGLAFWATNSNQMVVFLGGMLLMGVAYAAMALGRFAAAEVNPPQHRGRAIANVVLGGTLGAIFGPLLVGPAGQAAQSRGMDEFSGAYAISLSFFAVAALVVFTALRPDPKDIGRELTRLYPSSDSVPDRNEPLEQILRRPAVLMAMLSMVSAQVVMVSVMVLTALHMRDHQHGLGAVSLVISAHTIGMFAFSAVSGRLADRWGRAPVILSGAAGLLLACLAAPLSNLTFAMAISLFLLGLGWNFCFVGGSTLLSDHLSASERSRTQGFNDLLVGLASALGSLGSGIIFARYGYTVMTLAGALLSLIPILAIWGWMRTQPKASQTQAAP
jgi:MFS family permease